MITREITTTTSHPGGASSALETHPKVMEVRPSCSLSKMTRGEWGGKGGQACIGQDHGVDLENIPTVLQYLPVNDLTVQ